MTASTETVLREAAMQGAVVLVYHSVGDAPVASAGLHHVSAKTLQAHLQVLGRYFEFVPAEALAAMPVAAAVGKAALTFDDGFANVFTEALPLAEAMGIPMTCFVNAATLDGAVLWREKVRCIETRGWTAALENDVRGLNNPEQKKFYRYSKHPSNDSRAVEVALDNFLAQRNVHVAGDAIVRDEKKLPRHPLVTYGNHSARHYVLSSLPPAVQRAEIADGAHRLARAGVRLSKLFSVPFGAAMDYNTATADALRQLGYSAALLSRQRLHANNGDAGDGDSGIALVERIMPRTENIADAVTAASKLSTVKKA